MHKNILKLTALIIAFLILICGCSSNGDIHKKLLQSMLSRGEIISFEDMEYEQPGMAKLRGMFTAACEASENTDVDYLFECIFDFYDEYDWFYTCHTLAYLNYCHDLTDSYWEDEYNFCIENMSEADALLEELYEVLAVSPCRDELEMQFFGDGFFESYEDEGMWDETFSKMITEEAQLQGEYYALSEHALEYEYASKEYYDTFADEMTEILIGLVKIRHDIANYCGYDSYAEFANDFYHYRDYKVEDIETYLDNIQRELVPIYLGLKDSDVWSVAYEYSTEEETMKYLAEAAENMGGEILTAFRFMQTANLYDISYGENKYNSSFETYLISYMEPFIFMNPTLTAEDKLTFAHEFGHFCNEYASYGTYAGTDVAEIFSQGMEFLSLCYTEENEALTKLKIADSLCTYVEQAAFADFEQALYSLEEDELTTENLYKLYEDIGRSYGFDVLNYDRREFVGISHFYTHPMYVISYVLSTDAALQIYEMELKKPGSGKKLLEDHLDTEESYLLSFLDSAKLTSPFAEDRIESVKALFEEIL